MADFRNALNTVIAELTPQPWDYTDDSGTTLTVIPAGLREDPGCAEVMIRITESHTQAAEIGVTTTELPGLIDALTEHRGWRHQTPLDSIIGVTPIRKGDVVLTVTEVDWRRNDSRRMASAGLCVPDEQRMPLASALRRALDVAHGWES
ncbi:hypothetical protein [Streptomyces capuensis]|uniref:hypothetical protein n=1 Tax=Streptomyces capuensis TaxID=1464056 RepID=UPI0004C026E2|nr:hypothetical protein [Streptomyces capuensis]